MRVIIDQLIVTIVVVYFCGGGKGVQVENHRRELEIINLLLNNGQYDPQIRAVGNDTGGTRVNVNMYVRSVQKLDDLTMTYQLQLTFRMQWLDKRLAYAHLPDSNDFPYVTLTPSGGGSSKIWLPDIFFSNEIEGRTHNLLMPNSYTRIFSDGTVLYSLRLSLTIACPMILKLFPFDSQTCSLRMASYGYTNAHIIFLWKKDDPVQVTSSLHLPQFRLEQFTTDYCDSLTVTGIYSCIRVDFLFARESRHYLLKIFCPMIMLVTVAYLSFWIGDTGVTVSFVTLLVMILSTMVTEGSRPVISYATALDFWIGCCLTFSFVAFLICVITKFLGRRDKPCPVPQVNEAEEIELRPLFDIQKLNLAQTYSGMAIWEKILVIVRIAYPILFIVFLIMYTTAYTTKKDTQHGVTREYVENEDQPGKMTKIQLPLF